MSDPTHPAVRVLVPVPERRQVVTRRAQRLGGRRECDMPLFAVKRADAEAGGWDPAEDPDSDPNPVRYPVH